MSALLNLQFSFSRSLMDCSDTVTSLLSKTEVPAFAIYSHAYHIRLQETLAKDYPALHRLIGDEKFSSIASKYNRVYPSESYSLRHYGQYLSIFLSSDPMYKQQPYLGELAAFEWELTDVFDLKDTPVAAVEDMANIPVESWPSLYVKLQSSIRWLDLRWNIKDIYSALMNETPVPDLIRQAEQTHYLIWRQSFSPHYRQMGINEWLAFKALQYDDFSELCLLLSELSETPDNAPLQAATYLKSWLAAGLFESVNYID